MTVTSTQATNDIAANPAGYNVRAPKQTLGSEDFMKLLSTQMSNQDPLKPMEDTAFISQMASFSSLAQMNQLTKDFAVLRSNQTVSSAMACIGRTVTVNPTGQAADKVTGVVSGVDTTGEEPLLRIGDKLYSLSSVYEISSGGAATASTTDTSL